MTGDAIVPIARLLLAGIFLASAPGHFSQQMIGYAGGHGVPMPNVLVPLAGLLAGLGGLLVATGWKARLGAWMLVLFLVPVTLTMHDFWDVADPQEAMMQRIHFMKNLSMLGGCLLVLHFGPGPYSLERRATERTVRKPQRAVEREPAGIVY